MRLHSYVLGQCCFALSLVLFAASTQSACGIVLYVDQSVTAPGDGLTWQTALADLQSALDLAGDLGGATEIRIGPGTYKPTWRVNSADARSATFHITQELTIRGGFAGTGAKDPNAQDPSVYLTALSGDFDGDDVVGFVNNGENAYHIVTIAPGSGLITLQGVRIRGGNAKNFGLDGGGLYAEECTLLLQNCVFEWNSADRYGGAISVNNMQEVSIEGCALSNNRSASQGGGIAVLKADMLNLYDSSVSFNTSSSAGGVLAERCPLNVSSCLFERNSSPNGSGSAIRATAAYVAPYLRLVDSSTFRGNFTGGSGALMMERPCVITRSEFERNHGNLGAGGLAIPPVEGSPIQVTSFRFVRNSSDWYGGGLLLGASTIVTNCDVSDNLAPKGGGIYAGSALVLRNCTVASNSNDGIMLSPSLGSLNAANCILWGNAPGQVTVDDTGPPSVLPPVIQFWYSNVQDGEATNGNISVDPLFIQPGCGNFRLGPNSPSLDTGSNSLVPAGLTLDLDGQSRIQNGTVDMGAYEGAHAALPFVACDDDIDAGELVDLVPSGGAFNGLEHAGARVVSYETDDATASLELITAPLHLGVGGYSELAAALRYETTLPDGGHRSKIVIPFDAADLGLLDYDDVEITVFSTTLGRWTLAVGSNIQDSPEHDGPVGDRIVVVGEGNAYGMTADIGDYGVFWNPVLQRGFAWANVDHQGDLAVGAPLPPCPSDCATPSDGVVGPPDLLEVISKWGIAVAGVGADTNADFAVNVTDLLNVIGDWGPCR